MSSYLSSYDKGRYRSSAISGVGSSYSKLTSSRSSSGSSGYSSGYNSGSTVSGYGKYSLEGSSYSSRTSYTPSSRYTTSTSGSSLRPISKVTIDESDKNSISKPPSDIVENKVKAETKKSVQNFYHCGKAFDAMCILLLHYSQQVIPNLMQELKNVNTELKVATNKYDKILREKSCLIKENEKLVEEQSISEEIHQHTLKCLEDSLREKYKMKMNETTDKYENEKETNRKEMENKEKEMLEKFDVQLNDAYNEYSKNLKEMKDNYSKEIDDVKNVHKLELEELKKLLCTFKNDSEANIYEKEIDSLRTVLEMKNAEIHELRFTVRSRETELEQLSLLTTKCATLKQKNAELNEFLETKKSTETRLSQQNLELVEMLEKEKSKTMKLSMDNDQLQYRLQNDFADFNNGSLKRYLSLDDADVIVGQSASSTTVRHYLNGDCAGHRSSRAKDIPVTVYSNDDNSIPELNDNEKETGGLPTRFTTRRNNGSLIRKTSAQHQLKKQKKIMNNNLNENRYNENARVSDKTCKL